MFFLPVILLILLFYFILLAGLFLILQIGIISFAFERIGIPPEHLFLPLFLSLFGSLINIPVKRISSKVERPGQVVQFFGWRVKIPDTRSSHETLIAVNLGGAAFPAALSIYLLAKKPSLILAAIISVILVSFIVHFFARPIRGVGIAVPALIPPLVAAFIALVFHYVFHQSPATIIAYIGGTLGTLIGADLTNLKRIGDLGAPVASIGGAGTFDGIFLTGIIAVLLASL